MSLKQQRSVRSADAELALAAACCAWPLSVGSRALVRERASQVVHWDAFGHLVEVHRIAPLVHRALVESDVEMPRPLAECLRKRAQQAAGFDLRLAAESIRLQRAFEDAGIAMLVLKGVAAGMLAYGQLGMKMSWDIDVLVDRIDAEEGRRLLGSLGYRATFDEGQCEAIGDLAHELTFRHSNGIELDLHIRLCANPHALAGIDARGPSQTIGLAMGSLTTLADGPLFAYLAYHGAIHHWSRLKWLADFNAFAVARSSQLGALLDTARDYGVSRSASNALKLAHELLGTEWPVGIAERLEESWIARQLRADVTAAPPFRGVSAARSWRSWLLQFGVERNRRHLTSHLKNRWYSTIDRATLRLPRRLAFAYHLVRIPLFVWRSSLRMTAVRRRGLAGPDT